MKVRMTYRGNPSAHELEVLESFNACMILAEELEYNDDEEFIQLRENMIGQIQLGQMHIVVNTITGLYMILKNEMERQQKFLLHIYSFGDVGSIYLYQSLKTTGIMSIELNSEELAEYLD